MAAPSRSATSVTTFARVVCSFSPLISLMARYGSIGAALVIILTITKDTPAAARFVRDRV